MDPVDLIALTANPAQLLVALDFDGTLAPIVADPDAAVAHPDVLPALRRLSAAIGHLAIITGRPAAVAAECSGFATMAASALAAGRPFEPNRLVVLGHYGAERWDGIDAQVHGRPLHPGVAQARATLTGWLADATLPVGASLEDKGRSVAVHTRRAEDPEAAFATVRARLEPLARRLGLTVEPGRLVVELRPPGVDKGSALRELVGLVAARAVVYVGDDLGDLPAFEEVVRLRSTGPHSGGPDSTGMAGLVVCAGSDEVTALRDRADLVLDGPAGVAGWLHELAAAAAAAGSIAPTPGD